ncbi:hypothetical protein Emed_000462 [Eimeria media]
MGKARKLVRPMDHKDEGTAPGELIVQRTSASRASQLHEGSGQVKARKLLTQTLFAVFLSALAALSLLLTCYHVARPTLSWRNQGRALASQFPDSDDEDERSFIVDTCLELHESLGYVYESAPLPEKEEAISAIASELRQYAQSFVPQRSSSSSIDVGILPPPPPQTTHYLPLESAMSHASAPRALASMQQQPPPQTPSSEAYSVDEFLLRFIPPRPPHSGLPSFEWLVGSLGEFKGGSTTASFLQPPKEQRSPGFISQSPSAADFGLSSKEWGPPVESASSSAYPTFTSPSTRQVAFREEGKRGGLDVAGWGPGQLQIKETERGTYLRHQEEGDQQATAATRTELPQQPQAHLPSSELQTHSEPIDLSLPQSSARGPPPPQPSPAMHAPFEAPPAGSPESSELSPHFPSTGSAESARLHAEKRSASLLSQSPPTTSSVSRGRSQTPSRGRRKKGRTEQAKSEEGEPSSRKRLKTLGFERSKGLVEEEERKPEGSKSTESEELPLTTSPQHSAGHVESSESPETEASFVEITLKSGLVIKIPHPPRPMPPNTHPYYRLPTVPPDAIKSRFYVGFVFLPGTVNNIIGHLAIMREQLIKRELDERDVHIIIHESQYLLKYLLVWQRRPLEPDQPNQALTRIGMRYLCLEGLLNAVQLLGPAMHPQDWFPLIVEEIPITYHRPRIFGRPKSVKNLIYRFTEALAELKRGVRPSLSETLYLKRILFKWPKTPAFFKSNKWDPWREDDKEDPEGGVSGPS